MATKIVSTPSDPLNGEINVNDLNTIIGDFEDSTTLLTCPPPRQLTKTSFVAMKKEVLEALLVNAQPGDYVSIRFGITLPGQLSCVNQTTDISNQLTVAILLAQKTTIPDPQNPGQTIDTINEKMQPDVGNYVITAGFRNDQVVKFGGQTLCCGDPNGDT